ncbi:MAG: hypothetical protein IMY73_05065 [Bacteroidetes bacterium]|nr:hypothetical protein [Bacteroidota bacterium]
MKILSIINQEKKQFLVKPDTALLRNNDAYYIPPFSQKIEARCLLLVKVLRVTKAISVCYAGRCYDEMGVAIEFLATDVLEDCIKHSAPWDIALSYDKALAVPNNLVSVEKDDVTFEFSKNGEKQTIVVEDVRSKINEAISYLSHYVTLKIGDMVTLPLNISLGEVAIGDVIKGKCSDIECLDFDVK